MWRPWIFFGVLAFLPDNNNAYFFPFDMNEWTETPDFWTTNCRLAKGRSGEVLVKAAKKSWNQCYNKIHDEEWIYENGEVNFTNLMCRLDHRVEECSANFIEAVTHCMKPGRVKRIGELLSKINSELFKFKCEGDLKWANAFYKSNISKCISPHSEEIITCRKNVQRCLTEVFPRDEDETSLENYIGDYFSDHDYNKPVVYDSLEKDQCRGSTLVPEDNILCQTSIDNELCFEESIKSCGDQEVVELYDILLDFLRTTDSCRELLRETDSGGFKAGVFHSTIWSLLFFIFLLDVLPLVSLQL